VLGVASIVVLIGAALFFRSRDANPFSENTSALTAESAIETWEGRVEIWSRAIYGIQDFAFTGMGMNTFRRVVNVLYPLFLVGPDTDISHAHNEFLQAALDLGVPGLIAFTALYFGATGMLWAIWRQASTTSPDGFLVRAIALGLGAGLLGHLVYGMTDADTLGSKPGVLFWMLLGLIAGLYAQLQSGRLAQWGEWLGMSVSRVAPPLSNPEALDWYEVIAAAMWIAGLAFLLALLSLARSLGRPSIRQVLATPNFRVATAIGIALFASGMFLSDEVVWEKLGWVIVMALSFWEGATAWKSARANSRV
jgi:uncharacterized membrane protein